MMKVLFLQNGHGSYQKEWTGVCLNEDYARMYYITEGEAEIWHHGEYFPLTPGCLYLIPPKSNMKHRCRKYFNVAWFHFNIYLYGCVDLFNYQKVDYTFEPAADDRIKEEMLLLLSLLNKKDICSQFQAQSLLLTLVSHFISPEKINNQAYTEKMSRLLPVLEYIDKNTGKSITLKQMAKLAAYEPTYFSTVFKQVFSVSPIRYTLLKRIDRAQFLLRCGDMKLGAIADELGFVDAFHFSRTFKKITGESPSDYRARTVFQVIP